ncbi:MAG: 5'-methylthioadenosine/adenosylhomocysteine nucleosidase [Clostridia bacterium]|nr:5'-methylthioadenosine/adenosylhomocysteine nucleosidase [Clostridia bacterium]
MKLGLIAAMQIEAEQIISAMTEKTTEICGSITYTAGKIGETEVICAVCGIGKVFAAMCAQTMIVRYAPDAVINTGVGGTLTKNLSIGDIAVSADTVQHDMDTSALGDPVGLISGINVIRLPADEKLRDAVCEAASALGMKTYCGTIASGDRFIADAGVKKSITDRFDAIACEMEGAAVGQVCYVNKVPYLVIRAISDDADGGACEDYPAFAKKSAENSARLVIALAHTLTTK